MFPPMQLCGARLRLVQGTAPSPYLPTTVSIRVSARYPPAVADPGTTRELEPRGSLTRLRDLVSFSVSLVWRSCRGPFVALTSLQLVSAALLAGQVGVVAWLLAAILVLGESTAASVLAPIAILALLTALSAAVGSLQGSLSRLVGESVARTMWQMVLNVSTSVGLRQFEDSGFFDHLERVRTSALTRPFAVTNGLVATLGALASIVGLGATLVVLNPLLLPLLAIGGLPVLLTGRLESGLEYHFARTQTPAIRRRTYLSILLTGRDEAKEVRAFGLARNLRSRFDDLYGQYLEQLRTHLRKRAGLNALGQLTSALVLGVTLFAMVWLIASGGLSVAQAGAALVAIRMLAGQVQALAGGVQAIFESGLFINDLQLFLRLPVESEPSQAGAALDFDVVDATHVSFTYPGREERALDDVSIRIPRGQVIALVGENGSGKSTLAKIVAGLYPPDVGTVTWDDVPQQQLAPGTVRASTALIFQDFIRYAMDARANIALGRPDDAVDDNRVRTAAEASGVGEFVAALPQGYETPLTRMFDGGHDLSGGQWQRLAIARAFYRDAPLVILDEPSAALDPRAEYELFSSLRSTIEGRSALVISHRFSTVRNADRIYVLDGGRVAESGTHDELMATDGIYAELFRLQATAYLPDERH